MAQGKSRKAFIIIGLFFIALGIYLSGVAGQDKLNLPYRIVPHTSGDLANPGDILFIGDTQVLAWEKAQDTLTTKASAGLRTPLTFTFQGLENGGIHRVIAYLHELLADSSLARPKLVVYALGHAELQEVKIRPVMLHRVQRQLAKENDSRWATILHLAPFLRPWVIDVGEPLILGEPQPWPDMREAEELLYREVALQLFPKELAILAQMIAQAKIRLVVLLAPLNLYQVPAVWPSSTSLTLQKIQREVAQYLSKGEFKPAAQLLRPLLKFSGNARTWYDQGRIEEAMDNFTEAMQAWRTAASLNADRDEAFPAYNVIAQQSAAQLPLAIFDLATPAEKYLWAKIKENAAEDLAQLTTAKMPGEDFYQAQAAELGTFLQQVLLAP